MGVLVNPQVAGQDNIWVTTDVSGAPTIVSQNSAGQAVSTAIGTSIHRYSNTQFTCAGLTNGQNVLLDSVVIPGNTVGANGMVRIQGLYSFPGAGANTKDPLVRIGPTSGTFATASAIARSHDANCGWNNIETAAGVYNWATMDAWMAAHAGQDIIYVVFGTPAFWTTSVDNSQSSYGVGSLAFPDKAGGTVALTAFMTALVTRYVGKIKYVEIWNEPKYISGSGSYFVGTATQLAQIAKLANQAAKAVDPSIKVLSTSPTGLELAWVLNDSSGSDLLHKFLSASDGAGGFGKTWVDAIAVHTYSHNGYNNEFSIPQIATNVKAVLAANSMSATTELWVTETSAITPTLTSMSVESQKAFIARSLVLLLASGFSRIVWYGLGALGFTDPTVIAYWSTLRNLLQGATLGPVNYRTNGAGAGQVGLLVANQGVTEGNVFATINGARFQF